MRHRRTRHCRTWLALVLVGLGTWTVLHFRPATEPRLERLPLSTPVASPETPADSPPGQATSAGPVSDPDRPLETLFQRLGALDPESRRNELLRFRTRLTEGGEGIDAAGLIAFLESGQDLGLGLPFLVGEAGRLESWPTLRVAALDWLGAVGPAEAAAYARVILERKDSADEWAVALRNLGRHAAAPDGADYFRAKTLELLRHQPWALNPTRGYLQAFDAVPAADLMDALDDLDSLSDPTGPYPRSTQFAAKLSVDRLVIRNPASALPPIFDSGLFASSPGLLATLVARADPRDPATPGLLARHLTDPSVSEDERQRTVRLFPHASFHVSDNLLTDSPSLTLREVAERDREAIRLLSDLQHLPLPDPLRNEVDKRILTLQQHWTPIPNQEPQP